MLKTTNFFGFEFLGFFLLLMLLLLLLEGACVVTPLPTNKAGIGKVGKNKTKWGSDVFWNR
jgi:hypothetical protein